MARTPSEISARNAGLALASRINHWMIAGAVTASGMLSLVAAHAFHGHTVSAKAPASSAVQQSQSSSGDDRGVGLQQPAQAPAPSSPAPAPAVSGGS